MKNIKASLFKIITLLFGRLGWSTFASNILIKKVRNDIKYNKKTNMKEKLWAYRRGFLSDKIEAYGLTENNYRHYLSDFDYWKLHPINGTYSKWIDDKLIIRYILQPFNEYMPKYYFQIVNKKYHLLPDCPPGIQESENGIIALLKIYKQLALKPVSGSMGEGFYKLSYKNGYFHINEAILSESMLIEFIHNIDGYIATEYLISHEKIRRIYPGATNTLRVMVINEKGSDPILANAFMRFGTTLTGTVDNASAGGIFAKVNTVNGIFSEPRQFVDHKTVECKVHPDTGLNINGTIPHWKLIKDVLIAISLFMPQLKYMGYDVAITDEGFKIFEINSLQNIRIFQVYYPLLKENVCEGFFNRMME